MNQPPEPPLGSLQNALRNPGLWGNAYIQNEINEPRLAGLNLAEPVPENLLASNIECMEQYKVNGKYQMPFEASEENVYFYLGHGSSLTKNEPHRPLKIEEVPENCLLITQTVCGIINMIGDDIFRAFCNPENAEMWKDPVAHKEEIESLFRDLPGIHIHYPKCSFVDMSFLPCADNSTIAGKYRLEMSGIISLEKAHEISEENPWISGRVIDMEEENGIPREWVEEAYRYAEYPKLDIAKRRGNVFQGKSTTLKLSLNDDNLVTFDSIKTGTSRLSRHMTVYELMKIFPGVHFFVLCRPVQDATPFTRKQILQRRRHSAVLQNTPFNTLAKVVGLSENKVKEMGTDDDIVIQIEGLLPKIKADPSLSRFHSLLRELLHYDYKKSFNLVEPIFKEKYLSQYYLLLQEKRPLEEMKRFINILEPEDAFLNQPLFALERDLLNDMAAAAFNYNRGDVLRYLCSVGAPLNSLISEYKAVKKFLPRKTLRRKMFMVKGCNTASKKGKTRRNT